jgi:adenosylmethionine-8-amino-7-oxononanoate aminotransferase
MTRKKQAPSLGVWDRQYLWHPFTQMQEWEEQEPVIIERGKGSYLFDIKGNRYLDGTSSIWVNLHGHRHPALDRALNDQRSKVAHTTLLGLSNPPAILLARELVRIAPRGLTRVFFSDNGSTAVEVALKMAVQYWKQARPEAGPKHSFVHLKLAYHGDTIGAVSVGNIELFHAPFKPLLFPTQAVDPPYCYRCPLKMTFPECRLACLDPVEQVLRDHRGELAGFIIEPLMQAAAGMISQPPGYLYQRALHEIRGLVDCRRSRDGIRPHRGHVCVSPGRRDPRSDGDQQRVDGRLPAACRDADHGGYLSCLFREV